MLYGAFRLFTLFNAEIPFTVKCKYPSFAVSETVKVILEPDFFTFPITETSVLPSLSLVIFSAKVSPARLNPSTVLPVSLRKSG